MGAVQEAVDKTYRDKAAWTRMSIMSTAGSGFFSSDRCISQYAAEVPLPPHCCLLRYGHSVAHLVVSPVTYVAI